MAISVQVEAAGSGEREAIANLWQLYLHDLGEYEGGATLDAKGLFDLGDYFDRYWTEAERHPFVILSDGQLVGFALVRQTGAGVFSIAEFFVRRGCRRSGIGAIAARTLFDRFRGRWNVAELESNVPAQRFWRRVIADYTGGKFSEGWSQAEPKGPMQIFSNVAHE